MITVVWFMVLMGMLRATDPDFYAVMLDAADRGDVIRFVLENDQRFTQSSASSIVVVMRNPLSPLQRS